MDKANSALTISLTVCHEANTGVFSDVMHVQLILFSVKREFRKFYFSRSVTWRLCVMIREEPELFTDIPWFYYSIPRDFETQVLQIIRALVYA